MVNNMHQMESWLNSHSKFTISTKSYDDINLSKYYSDNDIDINITNTEDKLGKIKLLMYLEENNPDDLRDDEIELLDNIDIYDDKIISIEPNTKHAEVAYLFRKMIDTCEDITIDKKELFTKEMKTDFYRFCYEEDQIAKCQQRKDDIYQLYM